MKPVVIMFISLRLGEDFDHGFSLESPIVESAHLQMSCKCSDQNTAFI